MIIPLGLSTPFVYMKGSLGNCWFVSSIAAVTMEHDLSSRLFRDLPQLHAVLLADLGSGDVEAGLKLASKLPRGAAELRQVFSSRNKASDVRMAKQSSILDLKAMTCIPLHPLGIYQVGKLVCLPWPWSMDFFL